MKKQKTGDVRLREKFLKLRGRPSDFIEDINYITPSKLVKTLKRYDMEINDMTLPVNYQITKRKSLKGNLISILGKVFNVLGIKPTVELLIKNKVEDMQK